MRVDTFFNSLLALWLILTLTIGSRKHWLLPLLIVILAEVANECLDRLAHGQWFWWDTLGDAVTTIFWPLLLTAALRWHPLSPMRQP